MSTPSVISARVVGFITAVLMIIMFGGHVDVFFNFKSNDLMVQLQTTISGSFHAQNALNDSLTSLSGHRLANMTLLIRKSAKKRRGSAEEEREEELARARAAIRRVVAGGEVASSGKRSLTVDEKEFRNGTSDFIYRNARAFHQ
ncbi:hypothetical protein Ancab_023182 [Ancistrocladus abbreviatus]